MGDGLDRIVRLKQAVNTALAVPKRGVVMMDDVHERGSGWEKDVASIAVKRRSSVTWTREPMDVK